MPDREKVKKGLQAHADGCGYRSHHCDVMECPYRYGDESCDIEEMCRDALALLKEQQELIDKLTLAFLTLPDWNPVVVRCKDCKHWDVYDDCPTVGYCDELQLNKRDCWFCADGERRTDDA